MNQADKDYLTFLQGEHQKASEEINECLRREDALNKQIQMISEERNFATSDRIRLEKEIAAMKESAWHNRTYQLKLACHEKTNNQSIKNYR